MLENSPWNGTSSTSVNTGRISNVKELEHANWQMTISKAHMDQHTELWQDNYG
jgi:hypothetical protein